MEWIDRIGAVLRRGALRRRHAMPRVTVAGGEKMPDGHEAVTITLLDSIDDVAASEWDACAGTDNPFVSHCFLQTLEESGSVGKNSGWVPQHVIMQDQSGRLLGAAPMYLKSHSQGEYVFDWGWADAYERAGGRYYPKLQVAVPFSPVTGPRLLVRPGPRALAVRDALIGGLVDVATRYGVSSLHVTFAVAEDVDALAAQGFLVRHGHQFHWHNRGYGSFDDFLADLSSRKRKNIRKEREKVAEMGIRVDMLHGDDIHPRHWDEFHRFYVSTYDRKWGYPYLTRSFFAMLGERMADRVGLVRASIGGSAVAGALNLVGENALYGRNWGCDVRYPFLHFECCYYQAIDFAIEHKLATVEAGTQGPHKIQRGYLPVRTQSAHWIRDEGFRHAVDDFLHRERRAEAGESAHLAEMSPFRNTENDPS
jgi:predicted N-acyltransferase